MKQKLKESEEQIYNSIIFGDCNTLISIIKRKRDRKPLQIEKTGKNILTYLP